MACIAFIYMGCEGQTQKISARISDELVRSGYMVSSYYLADIENNFSPESFDAFVLGCSVRYGKHHLLFRQFVERYTEQISSKPSFFFSVNLAARKLNRSQANNNIYIKKYLESISWVPNMVEVFAGALRYSQYNFFNKIMIKMIMKITGGPTDTGIDVEFTDWKCVVDFSDKIKKMLIV